MGYSVFCLNKYTNKNMSESGKYFLPPSGVAFSLRDLKKKKHVLKLDMMTVQNKREYAYTLCQNEETNRTSHSNKKHIPTPIKMNTNIYRNVGKYRNKPSQADRMGNTLKLREVISDISRNGERTN